jgi:uncharacterized surface protein with fasciclin (FAS1) repeats
VDVKSTKYYPKKPAGLRKHVSVFFLLQWIILSAVVTSCNTERIETDWFDEDAFTIGQYLEKNKVEYSRSYQLLQEAKLLIPLSGYNPYGDGYSLFLPTNQAIDNYIQQSPDYASFEEMIQDTGYINFLARYHTVKRGLHTDEFPDGVLLDSTLTGNRLVIGYFANADQSGIQVNNMAPIVQSNLKMTNGYIHVIADVLQNTEVSGYDWLQQQEEYSILAQAMELSGVKKGLWWKKYTILAEHDSVYHRNGIYSVQDLIDRISSGSSLNSELNPFYQFAAFHMVGGEYYLNELKWGSKQYVTRVKNEPLNINVAMDIRINPGVDIYQTVFSDTGDTVTIDYVFPIWENSNQISTTGPIHSISELLYFEPFPDKKQ